MSLSANANEASTGADFNVGGNSINVTFNHSRTANFRASTFSEVAINFFVDEDALYQISGSHSVSDQNDGEDGKESSVSLRVNLSVGGVPIFHNNFNSINTLNESFSLGTDTGQGDALDQVTGSPDGMLLAGIVYRLEYGSGLSNSQTFLTDKSASSVGSTILTLAPIPEPSAALIVMFGLAAVTRRRPSI